MDISPQHAESESALVAVVTGAAQGIGRKVAEVLATEGYALVLADIKEPGETLAAVRETGAEATASRRCASGWSIRMWVLRSTRSGRWAPARCPAIPTGTPMAMN
ncbi:SDR family NAD(P)-dependent oxidoreductase [Streptomyces inhibens]|uniref:SDR family NAD(P)-dependent oxidoreductase n=1 Tax=Streptomyces inhibens TaxID=2293571 RepID=UPI00402AA07F